MATSTGPIHDGAPHPADAGNNTSVTPRPKADAGALSQSQSVAIAQGETASSAIAAREKASIEARFLMAMHRPRDFETCRRRLLDACKRPVFAELVRYEKPVGKEKIKGLSVRFAEEARVLWGNISVSSMVVFDDHEKRIIRTSGVDLETNAHEEVDIVVEKFVERRFVKDGMEVLGARQNSTGQTVYKIRAIEDDLTVKVNAQIAKARRNVILALIPADVKEECEQQSIDTMANRDKEDPDAARRKLLDAFWRNGVEPKQIAELLGHSTDKLTPAEMGMLRGYGTAMKEEGATWQDIVDLHASGRKEDTTTGAPVAPKSGNAGLAAELEKKAPKAAAADASNDKLL